MATVYRKSSAAQYGQELARRARQERKKASQSGRLELSLLDQSNHWQAWVAHLKDRKGIKPFSMIKPRRRERVLLWGGGYSEDAFDLIALLSRRTAEKESLRAAAKSWLAELKGRPSSYALALEALAWAYALPRLASVLKAATWWQLLETLLRFIDEAEGAAAFNGVAKPTTNGTPSTAHPPAWNPLQNCIFAGELPLVLSHLLPELKPCRRLATDARKNLSADLLELHDGQGMPHSSNLPHLLSLLACFTRCSLIAKAAKKGCFLSDAKTEYQWLIRQALRWMRAEGTLALSPPSKKNYTKELLEAALAHVDDADDWAIAKKAFPKIMLPEGADKKGEAADPQYESEWACAAQLRNAWHSKEPRLSLIYPDNQIFAELEVGGKILLSGDWQPKITIDRQKIEPIGNWEQICYFVDDDGVYIELEQEWEEGWRVQRQFFLADDDSFLFAADAVYGNKKAKIDYACAPPLGAGISFERNQETQEGWLTGTKRWAAVVPLALPEWRIDSHRGELIEEKQQLLHRISREGAALYAPLWFDLDRKRMQKPLTWRQLTVAEQLAILPIDVAVGYLMRSKDEQWLIYRSMAERGNRTLLGQNTIAEFLLAQFDTEGEICELVEVE